MIAISSVVPLLHQASAEVRSGSQFLKCRTFQTVEVAHAQRRLLKDTLVSERPAVRPRGKVGQPRYELGRFHFLGLLQALILSLRIADGLS
jgi:hypothetical protein